MRESFGEYQKRLQRIAKESAAEWQKVHNALMLFNGREVFDEGLRFHVFQGVGGAPSTLALEDVHVVMSKHQAARIGVLPKYRIVFMRRPAGPGEVFYENPPIENEEWSVTPVVESGAFLWELPRAGHAAPLELTAESAPLKLSAEELADEIAKGLTEYFLRYEAAKAL